jgi:hypothetical protein
MIDRPLATPDPGFRNGLSAARRELPVVVQMPDGAMDVRFGPPEESPADAPFRSNLAEYLSEHTLQWIANDLKSAIDEDKSSRGDWEDALSKGLDLLGIKIQERTIPWPGACGVVHPMILEAAVRFQSKSIARLFPAEGPAHAKIIGESDQQKIEQAKRVARDMNYWILERMLEYRDETEQLLFALPVDGSAFRKLYYDPLLKRPVAQFVPASDFIMPFGFPNLETCPRYTHIVRQSYADVVRLQGRGFYRDCPLQPAPVQLATIEEKVATLSGIQPSYARNELLTLHEIHTDLIIDELRDGKEPLPYIVTIDELSNQVLAIRRNWTRKDPNKGKVQHFVHYKYVPWKGAYGLGLVHLIGGIGKGCTSILRQLVDAGTCANLPGGLKARNLRVKGDDTPIAPGEWRDVDIPAGKIADSVYPMPYKEPSSVLFQLLQMLVSEGKSFASIAELDISTSTQNAPVGTMLALIEHATEVISAVQARTHTALGRELIILGQIIRDRTGHEYDYDPPNAPRSSKYDDYRQNVSIIPVSDPASATMAQRVMEYQAALQLSAQAPQLYNLPLLHRSMLEVLGIDNAAQIVPDKTDVEPMDPVAENMAILTQKPVKAFAWQNHEAHITTHMAFAQDPKITQPLSQMPQAQAVQGSMTAHVAEHMAYQYRRQIEQAMGVPLPPLEKPLPPEIEEQISALVAQASQKVLQQDQQAMQAQRAQEQAQDPVLQMQQAEVQIKGQQAQAKAQADQQKGMVDAQRTQSQSQYNLAKLQADERESQAKLAIERERLALEEKKLILEHSIKEAEAAEAALSQAQDREEQKAARTQSADQQMADRIEKSQQQLAERQQKEAERAQKSEQQNADRAQRDAERMVETGQQNADREQQAAAEAARQQQPPQV